MRRVGAIDIGTNTFLCLIADVDSGKIVKTLSDKVEIVRLGEGVHKSREFLPQALERAKNCLSEFRQTMDMFNVERVEAVATSAARDVKNSQELIDIGLALQIPISIISGKKEAELTYAGVLTNNIFRNDSVVIDVGGGSTEITYWEEAGNIRGQSLDLGGVRLTESLVSRHPISNAELQTIRKKAREEFLLLPRLGQKKLVGVAGTPATLAALIKQIDYNETEIEGVLLTESDLMFWMNKLASMSVEERSKLKGLEPKRADIIVAGIAILLEAIQALGGKELSVSTRGVRYGLALELGIR